VGAINFGEIAGDDERHRNHGIRPVINGATD
jgi:hypothetical protein